MKILWLLLMLSLMACGTKTTDTVLDLKEAMAFGSMKELNNINPEQEKDLLVRLYQVPVLGENCFMETHGICRYKYYISVSTFDEYPETNIFKLSNRGEVTSVKWLAENKIDYVEIELSLNKYTKEALANNSSLENKVVSVNLKIDPKKLIEIPQQ